MTVTDRQFANKLITTFKLTRGASARIKELKADNPEIFIRIMIVSGGCAGMQYHILMDDYIGEMDKVVLMRKKKNITPKDVYVVVDETSLKYLNGGKIDFQDCLEFSGFTIDNPNVKAVCNCGNSFSCVDCGINGVIPQSDECQYDKKS